MRGRVTTEILREEREALVITEIPYQVNKATMVEKIAELVREKKIEGIFRYSRQVEPRRHARGHRAEA